MHDAVEHAGTESYRLAVALPYGKNQFGQVAHLNDKPSLSNIFRRHHGHPVLRPVFGIDNVLVTFIITGPAPSVCEGGNGVAR